MSCIPVVVICEFHANESGHCRSVDNLRSGWLQGQAGELGTRAVDGVPTFTDYSALFWPTLPNEDSRIHILLTDHAMTELYTTSQLT